MIAERQVTVRVFRAVGKAWLIEPWAPQAWNGTTYYRSRDAFVAACGYATVELIKELCAVISYRLGRDDHGIFPGTVLASPGDERYALFFGEIESQNARRTAAEIAGWEQLRPDDLGELRIATALAPRPIVQIPYRSGVLEIAPTMSTFGMYVAADDSAIAATIESVLPQYGCDIDWASRDIASALDRDDPIGSFDP